MEIIIKDIETILGITVDSDIVERFKNYNFNYDYLTSEEMNNYLVDVVDILTKDIVRVGKHRISDWENCWLENLNKFTETKNTKDLIPRYHSKHRYNRWKQSIIKPHDINFDYNIHTIFIDSIIKHYFKNMTDIFEFGCGPGYHLLRIKDYFKLKKLHGSDWTVTSQNLIVEVNKKFNTSINGFNFNFFKPNYNINIPENSGIYTVAALEQVGEDYEQFIEFLLFKKPKLCIHFEPIDELLDSNNLIDKLSVCYSRKRNYLRNFLPYLEKLEQQGKIEIIKKITLKGGIELYNQLMNDIEKCIIEDEEDLNIALKNQSVV
jgi:hypothetical protein